MAVSEWVKRFLVGPLHTATPFRTSWHTLLDECDALGADATLTTPLTDKPFRITGVQEPRIVIEFVNTGDSQPLQRDQFETLAGRISDSGDTFDLQRLPPDAEPYAAVLSLHPRYECNVRAGTLTETDEPTTSQLITGASSVTDEPDQDRTEPDLDIPRERLMAVDREKVDEAPEVTELSESAVYEIDRREYVRKAEVDEERKETRLQGLKDQLALSEEPKAKALCEEVTELEQRIGELTQFTPGTSVGTRS